ncbi:hypothetical protein R1flu_010538 [Riccia fluitans]|uniref:BRCT domain-containing protein n=1 Tax=Riccia fluitans TaxID=41844 RepID=A0ABD1Z589_9MARC
MAFRGQRVMLSRNLVPIERYDMILEKLKQNEAEVIQCTNPGYNLNSDFHVLYSFNNEKLAELQSHGCNVIGPECILQCARERRPLPNRKYTCCMSLEGMRILATGFEKKKKIRIEHLVSAMCGELYSNSSMDIDIVVAKNVLSPKYKVCEFGASCNNYLIQKPEAQSFQQHRRVSHEPYRLPPFAGLKVCATGILIDTRDRIADIINKNGGSFDADLTRECTHLISHSTDSDKYKVAKRHWCSIKLVNEQWFWDSFTEKVCLDESAYEPQDGTLNRNLPSGVAAGFDNGGYTGHRLGRAHEMLIPRLETATPAPALSASHITEHQSARDFSLSSAFVDAKSSMQQSHDSDTAEKDKESECTGESDDYLSTCRIFLAGFEPCEMRRLAMMVLDAGGTRYMEFQSRVTHVVLGKPSESDLKEIRQYSMWGTVHVVLPTWLEECSRQKREVLVRDIYLVPPGLLVQENYARQGTNKWRLVHQENTMPENSNGDIVTENQDAVSGKALRTTPTRPDCEANAGQAVEEVSKKSLEARSYQENGRVDTDVGDVSQKTTSGAVVDERPFTSPRKDNSHQVQSAKASESESSGALKVPQNQELTESQSVPVGKTGDVPAKPATPAGVNMQRRVFDGYVFEFTKSCPLDVRTEIIQWVIQGGGLMHGIAGQTASQKLDFLIVPHGLKAEARRSSSLKVVSPQWIRFCLEEGIILETTSHILFQPLPCDVPLPGFERFRFCVSQYADRERVLLYNLCHVLGAKYQEKRMTRKATHLLCMVGDGEKYEAALRWGIEVVTAGWVHACVAQNNIVDLYPYRPKRLTAAEREAWLAIPTQCHTAAGFGYSDDVQQSSQLSRQTQGQELTSQLAQDEGQTSQRERPGIRGKTVNDKKPRGRVPPASHEIQTPYGQKSANVTLSSQMAGGNLDPWDELSASWSNQQESKEKISASFKQKGSGPLSVGFKEPVSVDRASVQINKPADEITGPKDMDLVVEELKSAVEHNPPEILKEEETGPDVAAVIEGLLAQSNKVQSTEESRSPDDRILRSTSLNRRRDEHPHPPPNFKRPKLPPIRPLEFDEEELPLSAVTTSCEDGYAKFQESQLESQVVGYDEDFSGRRLIMERVRTRSVSTTPPLGSDRDMGENEMASWKVATLSRLFKAAAANKTRCILLAHRTFND